MSANGPLSEAERRAMSDDILLLANRISTAIGEANINPGPLMRLIGAGVAQLLVAQALTLNAGSLPSPHELGDLDV